MLEPDFIKLIKEDIKKLDVLIDTQPLYPRENHLSIIESITQRVNSLNTLKQAHIGFQKGLWVQVFDVQVNPFYAKIKGSVPNHPDMVTLEGVVAKDHEGNLYQRSFDIKKCLPVSVELGHMLEYENGLNKYKFEEHEYVKGEEK